jgi:integrase
MATRSDDKTLPAGLRRLPSGKVQARHRCGGCARHGGVPGFHTQAFDKQTPAQRWLVAQQAAVNAESHLDPKAGKVTFREFAEQWLGAQVFNESTREAVELRLRRHAFPALGHLALKAIRPSTVQAWIKGLDLAPSYVRVIFVNVSSVFGAAVDDEVIRTNPCDADSVRRNRPKVAARNVVPWPVQQVHDVRAALPEQWAVIVTLGAGLGLRQGEVFGLAVSDVDFLRGRVEVRRQVKLYANGSMVYAPPKGGASKTRTVPLPDSVRDALAAHLAREVTLPWEVCDGKPQPVRLLLSNREGNALNRNYFNSHVWKPALVAAGVEPSRDNGMHALRHFYASALLDGGESIKAVSQYLGHTDAGFTLRTYTHLMPSSDARTRSAVDAVLAAGSTRVTAVSSG